MQRWQAHLHFILFSSHWPETVAGDLFFFFTKKKSDIKTEDRLNGLTKMNKNYGRSIILV